MLHKKAIVIKEGYVDSSISEFSITYLGIPAPIFSHTAGAYEDWFNLEVSAQFSNMEVYVTNDGTVPSLDNFIKSDTGTTLISVIGSSTFKAVVYYDGDYSDVISMGYTFPEGNILCEYKVSFNAQLDGDYRTSTTLIDKNGVLVGSFAGAMTLGPVTGINQDEGLYGNGSIRFIHDGTSSWGGIVTSGLTGVDFTDMEYLVIAVKGNFDPRMGFMRLRLEDGNASYYEVNLMAYPYNDFEEWKEYVVPLTEFLGVDFSILSGIGLFDPIEITDFSQGDILATDVIVDFAFR